MTVPSLFDPSAYYDIVTEVVESWDKLKNIPNHSEIVGVTLYNRMYEKAPKDDIWKAYSFSHDDVESKSRNFLNFAKSFVRMMDVVVDMLGPDMELLSEELYEIGVRHQKYNILPHHYDLMGEALLYSLEEALGPKGFTKETKNAWKSLFNFMAESMMEASSDTW